MVIAFANERGCANTSKLIILESHNQTHGARWELGGISDEGLNLSWIQLYISTTLC